jgi:hypothetical protein
MELTAGDVKVVLEAIGEGRSGEYNEDDPEDIELLRFTVYRKNPDHPTINTPWEWDAWEQVEDASYCTQVPVDTPAEILSLSLARIFNEVYSYVEAGQSIKKICELLSWIAPEDADCGKDEANLRLIDAATDMLAALESLIPIVLSHIRVGEQFRNPEPWLLDQLDDERQRLEIAFAAISKATGKDA